MRKKFIKIILHIFGVMLFIFATAFTLLAAYGYQIDLLQQSIIKTSIIDITSKLKNVEIYLDDELIAQKAPYRIKNIKPGIHKLDVYKEDYTKWTRNIEVFEDYVAKVDDILLLPFDYESYLTTIPIDFEYNIYLINDNYIVFVSHEANELLFYKLDNNRLNKTGKINMIAENKNIYFIDNERLAIKDKNELIIVDLRNNNTRTIQIPDEFKQFTVAYNPDLTGYYMNSDLIYKANIEDDSSFGEITIINENGICSDDFEVISSYDHVFLMCDNNLYEVNNNDTRLIDDSVDLKPEISNNDESLLYKTDKGDIKIYNIYTRENELLARFFDDIESLKWHGNSKYIFVNKSNELLICDLAFNNCMKFFDENIYLNKSKPEYVYINDDTLVVYDLSEIF